MSDLMLDVGQANELKLAFRRADYTNDDIKQLSEGTILADVRKVLRGYAELRSIKHIINLDADPFVPDQCKVIYHQRGGTFTFDPSLVELRIIDQQRHGIVTGHDLRRQSKGQPWVLNANVLDYLLKHPRIIPEEWKRDEGDLTRFIGFWGTLYSLDGETPFVRSLYYERSKGIWQWNFRSLHFRYNFESPIAARII